MAYDEEFAHRVREQLVDEDSITEQAMFGGLAFLLRGNMSVGLWSGGGLMVRLGADGAEDALTRPHTRPFEMRGRRMKGWVIVESDGVKSKRQLAGWVRKGVEYAGSLPSKG
jgi:TfoX/Sxy family transcriptional regulator of competence genes